MGDNLAEDWWVEESPSDNQQFEKTENQVSIKDKAKENIDISSDKQESSLKRKSSDAHKDGEEKNKKKKAKKGKKDSNHELKRKRITDVPDEVLNKPGSPEDFVSAMSKVLRERIDETAINDVMPDVDQDFFPANSTLTAPADFLRMVLSPVWRSALKKSLYLKKHGSPALLIITSSAIRAVELNRQIKEFLDGKCKVAKLFAKHMKVEEQKKYLSKVVCQVGIGTPGRISLLIKQGALKTEDLVGVVLDWNWRDSKLKRLADGKESRAELAALVQDHIGEIVRGSGCKIGLL